VLRKAPMRRCSLWFETDKNNSRLQCFCVTRSVEVRWCSKAWSRRGFVQAEELNEVAARARRGVTFVRTVSLSVVRNLLRFVERVLVQRRESEWFGMRTELGRRIVGEGEGRQWKIGSGKEEGAATWCQLTPQASPSGFSRFWLVQCDRRFRPVFWLVYEPSWEPGSLPEGGPR
jgi:hypothetical protein